MSMTKEKAREILGDYIQEDGGLHSLGHYMAWTVGDKSICLDCHFDIEELEAIVWWMKNAHKLKALDEPILIVQQETKLVEASEQ